MKERIGVFGGLFDPVHTGHMKMAKCAMETAKLDKVIFVPNGQPPHKNGDCASPTDRFNMLCIAVRDLENFSVSDFELDPKAYHYTVDTMRHFKGVYPDSEVFFILGADSLNYLDKWKDALNLIKENVFIVINRNFKKDYSLDENISKIQSLGGQVIKADMPFADISSTQIRKAILHGDMIESMMPTGVLEYIKDKKLYIGENYDNR